MKAPRLAMKRLEIPGLCERPGWWAVRPEEILAAIAGVGKGKVQEIATTPAGYPVGAVLYGPDLPAPGTADWAWASNSGDPAAYKTETDPQTVMLVCGTHGAETEAIAGAVNLISLMETGRDLRGAERPELTMLAGRYRLIIVPCLNMDGLAVSPDHLRGATREQFRLANQGAWADGSLVGYPACKKYSPLPPEKCSHLGGYPNADGINIAHDAQPGMLRSREAEGLFRLTAAAQTDLSLHLHTHEVGAYILGPSLISYPLHVTRTHRYQRRVFEALREANLRPGEVLPAHSRFGYSLAAACSLVSGGLSMMFEQPGTESWTFDEMLETFYVALETILRHGLTEPFSPRLAVMRGEEGEG